MEVQDDEALEEVALEVFKRRKDASAEDMSKLVNVVMKEKGVNPKSKTAREKIRNKFRELVREDA